MVVFGLFMLLFGLPGFRFDNSSSVCCVSFPSRVYSCFLSDGRDLVLETGRISSTGFFFVPRFLWVSELVLLRKLMYLTVDWVHSPQFTSSANSLKCSGYTLNSIRSSFWRLERLFTQAYKPSGINTRTARSISRIIRLLSYHSFLYTQQISERIMKAMKHTVNLFSISSVECTLVAS